MSARRAVRLAVALALVLGAGARAEGHAVSLSGFVGAGYLLNSIDGSAGVLNTHLFDFSGGVAVSGGFFNPKLLKWSVGADYQGNRYLIGTTTRAVDRVNLKAQVQLLSGYPVPVTLFATRNWSDFAERAPGAGTQGASQVTTFGGTATFHLDQYPAAFLSLSRTLVETQHQDERSFSGNTRLSAGLTHNLKAFEYGASYDTNWNSGTWQDQSYQSHQFTARASAPLRDGMLVRLNEIYYLRVPTTDSPDNPRFDTNTFTAGLQWQTTRRLLTRLDYTDVSLLVTAPQTPVRATHSQALAESLQWQWKDNLWLTQALSGSFASARDGDTRLAGFAQSLGLGLMWKQPWVVSAASGAGSVVANALAGVSEPETGGVFPLYGGNLNGSITGAFRQHSGTASYLISYTRGGPAIIGWTLTQQARLEAATRPTDNTSARLFFTASGSRREDLVLGSMLSRSLQLSLEGRYRQTTLQLNGGLGDGISEALMNPALYDGLFLPSTWNTHRRFAGLDLSSSFDQARLVLRLTGRLADLEAPGRPHEFEGGLLFSASYAIGRFRVSLEDRFAFGVAGASGPYRNNQLMLRLTRDFGWDL